MPPIRILPREIVNRIAAGEVIERPASVVKELVENAIDAGSGSITVEIEGDGCALIRVADNGCGMHADELQLAVHRHATSKLADADDLFAITTLGFRGEALPSILSVSRTTIASRPAGAAHGTSLQVEAGEVLEITRTGMPEGTIVEVRDLFFNTPARRKFLKSAATEQRTIIDTVARYALARAAARMHLSVNGREILKLAESSPMEDRIAAVFGDTSRTKTIPFKRLKPGIGLHGYLALPELSRPSRGGILPFVNGRAVKDPTLSAAVIEGYRGLLMTRKFPLAVIFVEIDPSAVDVNVHPAKAEVRFQNPSAVFGLIVSAIRETLGAPAPAPLWTGAAAPAVRERPGLMPAAFAGAAAPDIALPESPGAPAPPAASLQGELFERSRTFYADKALIGTLKATYALLEGPEGLYILDQHASHERVVFERLQRVHGTAHQASQLLLHPVVIELGRAEFAAYEELKGLLEEVGIDSDEFGDGAIAVRSVPEVLSRSDITGIIQDLVHAVIQGRLPRTPDRQEILARIACHRSVRAGRELQRSEIAALLSDLDALGAPTTCPHGRPLFKLILLSEIERWIGRRP